MTGLWLSATAMLLLALAFVVPALMRRRRVAGAVAVVLPLAAVGLYLQVGDPLAAAALLSGAPKHTASGVDIEAMVGRLSARLQQQPGDLAGWVMLARSYEVLGRRDDALLAWERALALAPGNADLRAQVDRLRSPTSPSPAP